MTYAERIVDYVWSVAPDGATNGELARQLGIRSQQTMYMLTQELMRAGRIRGVRSGATWVFHAAEETGTSLVLGLARANDGPPAARFSALASRVLAVHYAVTLSTGSVPGVPMHFDFVSADKRIAGDAKYFALVGGVGLPPAKFSIIAEYVCHAYERAA